MSNSVKVDFIRVFKRSEGGRWFASYTCPKTGRRVKKTLKTTLKTVAIERATELKNDILAGKNTATRRDDWAQIRKEYLETKSVEQSKAYVDDIRGTLNRIEATLAPRVLQEIDAKAVNRFRVALLKDKSISPATANKHLRNLRTLLRWAKESEYLLEAPTVKINGKDNGEAKGRPLCLEEFERMLAAVPKVVPADQVEAYERLLRGLWLSGLRLGEALNLRWDDTSEAMSLHVDGRNSVFRIPGGADKSKKARICPTVPDFVEFIAPMQEARGNVFPGIAGDVDHVSKRICKMGKKAGVWFDNGKAASAHDLRRSMATRWANLVPIFVLKDLLRHADISTTQKYYLGKDAAKATAVAFDAVQPPKTGGNVPKVSQSGVRPELKALFEQ